MYMSVFILTHSQHDVSLYTHMPKPHVEIITCRKNDYRVDNLKIGRIKIALAILNKENLTNNV